MRLGAAFTLLLLSACGGSHATPPPIASTAPAGSPATAPPARPARCDTYHAIVDDAMHTPPTAFDDAPSQGMTACGCVYGFHTTSAMAARVAAAFEDWRTLNCATIKCDPPCP